MQKAGTAQRNKKGQRFKLRGPQMILVIWQLSTFPMLPSSWLASVYPVESSPSNESWRISHMPEIRSVRQRPLYFLVKNQRWVDI
jgi:hypothetical protein